MKTGNPLFPALLICLLLSAHTAEAQKPTAEKVLNRTAVDAGTPITLSMRIYNPFDSPLNVRITDKDVIGGNGIDIQCLEYTIPNKTTIEVTYPDIVPYTGGTYALNPASLTYTNPETGKEETISTNSVSVSVNPRGATQGTTQGITTIYRCDGINIQSTSYSYSGGSYQPPQGEQQGQSQHDQQSMVQNNQMDQDTNALREEMQRQEEERKQVEEGFQKTLENNPEYRKQDQMLREQGYKPTSSDNRPVSNDTGSFSQNYQKESGENATLSGEMKNGTIENIQAQTSEETGQAIEALRNSPAFQELNSRLTAEGYNSSTPIVQKTGANTSKITVPYAGNSSKKNITAEYVNNTIRNVEIEEEKENKTDSLLWLAAVVFAALAACLIYRKYGSKRVEQTHRYVPSPPTDIDYQGIARKMLAEADSLFSRGMEKDAYEKVSQAVRFYYAHKLGEKRDLSSAELLNILKKENQDAYPAVQRCLSLCGLVEFAKYRANREDYSELSEAAKKIIG